MSNSKLISYTELSPNRNTPRTHAIDTVTVHCYAGHASVEDMGAWFSRSSTQYSANYGIGDDGRIGLFVPESDRSWCSSSRENDHRAITIECSSDTAAPNAVNKSVYNSLINLLTDICQRNGIKQLVWSNSAHERINHINGCNMTAHRDYANKACPGDYLYSRMRDIAADVNARMNPVSASGIPTSKADFISKVAKIAVHLYGSNKILPSVVIGQCCLETGYGLGADSTELVKRNNLLGMKTDLINNTWSDFSVWDGQSFSKVTPEYRNGKLVYVTDSFRIYKNYENCIQDYEQFLLHVRNDHGYKYRAVQGLKDPRTVITLISTGGYATDPSYIEKVMKMINENNLTQYDKEAGAADDPPVDAWYRVAAGYLDAKYIGQTGAYAVKANAIAAAEKEGLNVYNQSGSLVYSGAKDKYAVQRRLSETKYRLGLFSNLDNAKRQANANWGFRVYDMDARKLVYKPKLARWQKLCAACVRLNQWLVDDIAAGKDWRYYNIGHVSESTFFKTRKANKLYTNCMGGVGFAMKESGLPASACSWYGQKGGGIRWLNPHAEADLRKYADLIKIGNRTPEQLVSDGTLCPGDILTFVTLNHTCIYLGNHNSYDSGHAFCRPGDSGEGAKFVKWIGPLSWSNYKVGYIIRLKG